MELGRERKVFRAGGDGTLELDEGRGRTRLEVEEAARHEVGEDPDGLDGRRLHPGSGEEAWQKNRNAHTAIVSGAR